MDEVMFKVSLKKVMDLVLMEERARIKAFYATTLNQATADLLDSYAPVESEVLKMFTSEKE